MRIQNIIGRIGEDYAARYLLRSGYVIQARNYRGGRGEIDVVASRDGQVVFVEVKARTSDARGTPREAVDRTKRQRMVSAARQYITQMRDAVYDVDIYDTDAAEEEVPHRFDIIEVYIDVRNGEVTQCCHIIDAFGESYECV